MGEKRNTETTLCIEATKKLPVTFEIVASTKNDNHLNKVREESYRFDKILSQQDFSDKDLAFLPIVVTNIEEDFRKDINVEKELKKPAIHTIAVEFETVTFPQNENILLSNSLDMLTSFTRYNSPDILNLKVVFDEISTALINEQLINNIEVIEPNFLSFSKTDLKDNLMDEESNARHANLPLPEAMNSKDEEKFKKIIDDLIDFKTEEELNEMTEEFQSNPLLEFENEFIDINFISLVNTDITEDQEDDLDTEKSKNEHSSAQNTDQTENEVNIPNAILTDEALNSYVIEDVSSEEATMQLLDDLSDLGDYRELPLLNEMLVSERYATVKERVKKLIEKISENDVIHSPTGKADVISFKAFNVFEDLFRTCDTEAKLILLDEMIAVGDKRDLEFLEELLEDNNEDIQFKANKVLEQLRLKLNITNKDKPVAASEIESPVHSKPKVKESTLHSKEEADLEYTILMQELAINPSSDPSDIFDLTFEISKEDTTAEEGDKKKSAVGNTSKMSFMEQLCHLSNKIIEKLNG